MKRNRERRTEIRGKYVADEAAPASLREAVARGEWWPEGLTTDGADHFVLPR